MKSKWLLEDEIITSDIDKNAITKVEEMATKERPKAKLCELKLFIAKLSLIIVNGIMFMKYQRMYFGNGS